MFSAACCPINDPFELCALNEYSDNNLVAANDVCDADVLPHLCFPRGQRFRNKENGVSSTVTRNV